MQRNYYYRDCQHQLLERQCPRYLEYIGAAIMGAILGAMLAYGI